MKTTFLLLFFLWLFSPADALAGDKPLFVPVTQEYLDKLQIRDRKIMSERLRGVKKIGFSVNVDGVNKELVLSKLKNWCSGIAFS